MKNRIWEYREKLGMSMNELSKTSGISTSTICRLENGETENVLLSSAIALSKALSTDVYTLFCYEKEEYFWGLKL